MVNELLQRRPGVKFADMANVTGHKYGWRDQREILGLCGTNPREIGRFEAL
jgi:hypothetical protein